MANWSLILNILLLMSVLFAILHMMRSTRREKAKQRRYRDEYMQGADTPQDDIIAVRKLRSEDSLTFNLEEDLPAVTASVSTEIGICRTPSFPISEEISEAVSHEIKPVSIMMFLLAKDGRQLAGYELLQTILAAGLRFGEGQLFHRHQLSNGQGPIICSLATATNTGTFDLQNIGAFSVRGLCLFMEASGNPSIDAERLKIMLDTAKQLSESLDAHLLDDERLPWSDTSLARYRRLLEITGEEEAYAE